MSTVQEILEIVQQRQELLDQRRRTIDRDEWRRLTYRSQMLHGKIRCGDDEYVGQPVEAVLREINWIYEMTIEGRVERVAADFRVRLLWKVVERKRAEMARVRDGSPEDREGKNDVNGREF